MLLQPHPPAMLALSEKMLMKVRKRTYIKGGRH